MQKYYLTACGYWRFGVNLPSDGDLDTDYDPDDETELNPSFDHEPFQSRDIPAIKDWLVAYLEERLARPLTDPEKTSVQWAASKVMSRFDAFEGIESASDAATKWLVRYLTAGLIKRTKTGTTARRNLAKAALENNALKSEHVRKVTRAMQLLARTGKCVRNPWSFAEYQRSEPGSDPVLWLPEALRRVLVEDLDSGALDDQLRLDGTARFGTALSFARHQAPANRGKGDSAVLPDALADCLYNDTIDGGMGMEILLRIEQKRADSWGVVNIDHSIDDADRARVTRSHAALIVRDADKNAHRWEVVHYDGTKKAHVVVHHDCRGAATVCTLGAVLKCPLTCPRCNQHEASCFAKVAGRMP